MRWWSPYHFRVEVTIFVPLSAPLQTKYSHKIYVVSFIGFSIQIPNRCKRKTTETVRNAPTGRGLLHRAPSNSHPRRVLEPSRTQGLRESGASGRRCRRQGPWLSRAEDGTHQRAASGGGRSRPMHILEGPVLRVASSAVGAVRLPMSTRCSPCSPPIASFYVAGKSLIQPLAHSRITTKVFNPWSPLYAGI